MISLLPLVLLQIDRADLRRVLRIDALSVVLGVLLFGAGLVTVALWARARRRETSLLWLGSFALLYGLRLLARTTTFRLCFDLPPGHWDQLASTITYVIAIPMVLFLRATAPGWRRLSNWSAVVLVTFAAYAVTSDIVLHRPDSARVPNNALAVFFILIALGWLFRPGRTPSRELRTLRVGVVAVSAAALADNLRGVGLLAFPGPDLEPIGFTVLVICLGTLVTRRVLSDARRLLSVDRELSIARQIQSSILPRGMPRLSGLQVAARYRPMTAVAGDFYDFLEVDGQGLGVLVADVSGHGVPAALIASMVKVAVAAQQGRAEHPASVLAGMNEALSGQLGGQYVTAAYLFIDGRAGLVRYAAAGHPPMLRSARGGLDIREVEQNGLPLGLMEVASYEQLEQPLAAGDRFLLYTDGLIEAANAAEDFFGLERVKMALATGSALAAERAADALLDTMDAWSGQPAGDDLTIVIVDCDGAT